MQLTAGRVPGAGRALGVLGMIVSVLLLTLARPAQAVEPQRLDSQIEDGAGVLSSGDRSDIAEAQDRLERAKGIQLWVAYEATFSGLSGQDWTDQTAQLSGLGGNDVLLAIATQDRAYGYSVPEELPISDAQLESVISQQVEPMLRASDWAGAAVAFADGIAVIEGGSGATGTGSAASTGAGAGRSLLPLVLLALLGLGAVLLFTRMRKRSRQQGGGAQLPAQVPDQSGGTTTPRTIEEYRQSAAGWLIEVDDSIRTSEEELGFAVAQFGEEAAAPFRAALAASKTDMTQAFAQSRRAEEAKGTPQEPELLASVIQLCHDADARLDAQVAQFDEMRQMERNVDTILPSLAARVDGLSQRLPGAVSTAERLSASYPHSALATVLANLDQATQRTKSAQESVTVGQQLLSEGDRSGAVARARAAEDAIGQATTLIDSVERAPGELAEAEAAIRALVAETQKDLAEADRLGAAGQLAGVYGSAQQALTTAQATLSSPGTYDPIATRRALEAADQALEDALGPVRDRAAQAERARALLVSAQEGARASIQAADDFITTRRGAVGAQARTRLAEAQRRFNAAAVTASTDPTGSLTEMQAADQLADQALALAQQDANRYQSTQMGGTARSGPDLGGMILGGILIDSLTRGSRGGGMRINTGGRGGGGFGGGGLGGSIGPGSFGGGGTRGRRGGGGRF